MEVVVGVRGRGGGEEENRTMLCVSVSSVCCLYFIHRLQVAYTLWLETRL